MPRVAPAQPGLVCRRCEGPIGPRDAVVWLSAGPMHAEPCHAEHWAEVEGLIRRAVDEGRHVPPDGAAR